MRVKNWRSFQHYKGRRPPWIKLHHDLLDNYEFMCLPLASRALAPCLWLLASESEEGELPTDLDKLAFRLRCTVSELVPAINALIQHGFIESASGLLAERKQSAIPETEAETETETETDSGDASRPGPKRPRKLPAESANAVKEACQDWTELLGGTAPGARIAGAWPALLRLAPWSEVRPVWRWYLAEGKRSGKAEFCKPQDFASQYGYWRDRSQGLAVRGRQPVESAVEANARVLEAVEQGRL